MNYMKRIGLVLILALSFGSIAFSADDAAILLEEAIYIEETLGDFDEAARIYLQIADNAESGRSAAAQALYRLGKYYEGRGRGAEAKTVFERLARQYPEQKELIFRVPGLANTRLDIPQFLPAPWEDGEMLTYSYIPNDLLETIIANATETTNAILHWSPNFGTGVRTDSIEKSILSGSKAFITESDVINGEKRLKFHSISYPIAGSLNYSTVLAKGETFTPIEKWSSRGLDKSLPVNYGTDYAMVWRWGTETNKTFNAYPLPDVIYDKEQIIYLLRCLPLKMGFETTLPLFNTSDGSTSNQRISVEGREQVVTPAGTFNAWKVAYGNKGIETYYWISDDSHRYPVKIQSSPTDETADELVSISKYERNRPVKYEYHDIRLSLPSEWFSLTGFVRFANDGYNEQWSGIYFSDSEFETSNSITLIKYPSVKDAQLLLAETVDGLIAFNQTIYRDYLVKTENRVDITVSGFPGIRFIAERKDGNIDIIVYSFVVAAGDKSIRVTFRARNEDFDRYKPVFDSIIESIKLK